MEAKLEPTYEITFVNDELTSVQLVKEKRNPAEHSNELFTKQTVVGIDALCDFMVSHYKNVKTNLVAGVADDAENTPSRSSENKQLPLIYGSEKHTGKVEKASLVAMLNLAFEKIEEIETKKVEIGIVSNDLVESHVSLSKIMVELSKELDRFPTVQREFLLTAFTLNPSEELYEQVKVIGNSPGFNSQKSDWMLDCEELGDDICRDLCTVLIHPRWKDVSWEMPAEKLLEKCAFFMEGGKDDYIQNLLISSNDNLLFASVSRR